MVKELPLDEGCQLQHVAALPPLFGHP
jgi:hypothetical protein